MVTLSLSKAGQFSAFPHSHKKRRLPSRQAPLILRRFCRLPAQFEVFFHGNSTADQLVVQHFFVHISLFQQVHHFCIKYHFTNNCFHNSLFARRFFCPAVIKWIHSYACSNASFCDTNVLSVNYTHC